MAVKDLNGELKHSFIKRLTALILVFNVILIVVFTIMTYFITKVTTQADSMDKMNSNVNMMQQLMENTLDSSASAVKIAADNSDIISFMISPNNKTASANAGKAIKSISSSCNGLMWCASDYNGTVITSEGQSMSVDLSGYEWYEDFLFGVSYQCRFYHISGSSSRFGNNDSDILAVMPVVNEDNIIGYVGMELSYNDISAKITANLHTNGAYTVICDGSGSIIFRPADTSGFEELFEGSGHTAETLLSSHNEYGKPVAYHTSKGMNFYYTCGIQNTNWTIAVFFDGLIILGSFYKFFYQQIIILACLFVLELIATMNVIKHESKDIPEISSSIAEISAGNYNFRINSDSENEIGLIANSVDRLAKTLQDKNAVIDDYRNLDPTTGLQNRYRMYETINDLIVSRDESRKRFALLFIDIDNFKWITEALGHRQGDEFLRIFGSRLKSVHNRVYSFSGDEFVALVEYNDDTSVIDDVIHKFKAEFANPIEILNNNLFATFAVGVAIYPDDDTHADMLLRDANIAVSRAKEKGKDVVSYYSNNQSKNLLSKSVIGQKLSKALENGEMFLNFQPIISVSNGNIHGFEVLIRWESDELGIVSPSSFVSIAEETGAIVDIGTWIFETACRQLKKMNEINPDIILSINVSPMQMNQPDFMEKIERVINLTNVNVKNIQVEITESVFLDVNDSNNSEIINRLNDMGMSIALDDFGTGFSSLTYLKSMPIKTLKVDKSFVDEICSKSKDYQITESIIDMVHGLGIKTVVEGVESIEQYNVLSKMQCDYIQGFLMSKPLDEAHAMEFIIKYDELHKPSRQTLEKNSHLLAMEREKNKAKAARRKQ